MAAYPFDVRPLTEPVDPAAVRAFSRAARAGRSAPVGTIVVFLIIGFIMLLVVVPVLGVLFAAAIGSASRSGGLSLGFLLPFIAVLAIIGVGVTMFVLNSRRGRTRRYRISRFATANGMAYVDGISDPQLPGMIFQRGSSRRSSALVRGTHPRFVEFGNYQYTTGSGKNSQTHHWGYVAVRLDVPLPNIVLDALGNNTLGTNLPSSFAKDQRLSLEGDFDRWFTLYCPRGYEADALYLFTPDIMARFIDHAAQLDVEIVDDWMFLYMQRPASTTDPATWAWLFGAVGALMTKFDQWARWRDDRLAETTRALGSAQGAAPGAIPSPMDAGAMDAGAAPALPFAAPAGALTPPPGVAPQGRRLRGRFSWASVAAIVIMLAVWILPRLFEAFAHVFLR